MDPIRLVIITTLEPSVRLGNKSTGDSQRANGIHLKLLTNAIDIKVSQGYPIKHPRIVDQYVNGDALHPLRQIGYRCIVSNVYA